MVRAYFDTTVPSWIVDGLVPPDEVTALKAAFARGDLIAPIGPVILDGLAGELAGNRAGMIQKLKLLRQFGTFHGMLKQPADILKEAIQAYADGHEPPAVTLPEHERRNTVGVLAGVIAGSRLYDADLKVVVGGVSALKLGWLANRHEAHREVDADPAWQQVKPEANPQNIPFQDYFAGSAADFAIGAAEPLGLADACRQRGVEGLFKLPIMRIMTGVALAQIYAEMIGAQGQPRKPDRNDGYDLRHAISASTADVFVTFDKRLADHVEWTPDLQAPRVVRSIRELLDAID